MDYLTVVIASLLILIIVAAMVLKMNLITAAGVGTISAIFGAIVSSATCWIVAPASVGLCALSGAISSMWSSTLTLYFAMMQAQAQGVHIGLVLTGG